MYREDNGYSYHSEGETTHGSNYFQNESTTHINHLDDGTMEITDTLPKKEYYMSLRKNGRSLGGSMNRVGTGSSAGLGTMTGTLRSGYLAAKSPIIVDFKPSGKLMECSIVQLDGTEEVMSLDRESYGQHLFDMICGKLGLVEKEYFGVRYKDKSRVWYWLESNKKITKQVSDHYRVFEFQVKFYPPSVDMASEELTKYYFSLQIRQDIITGELPCSFNVYALLGAYVIQSEAGDYHPESHRGLDYLRNQPLAPQNFQTDELLSRVCELHKEHRGQSPEEADKLFLENARRLALYGVDRHKVKNSEGEELILGVNHSGILLYKQKIRRIHFSWARLIKVSYKQKKVILSVRVVSKLDPKKDHIFKCLKIKLAKKLYQAIVDHHYFFRMIEMRMPKKPNLQPGFANRKYYKQPQTSSPAGFDDSSNDNMPAHKIKRIPPIRKEQSEDGWFTLPSHKQTLIKPEVTSVATFTEDNANHKRRKHKNHFDDSKVVHQENIRPLLPHVHWRMSPADCTVSVGMDDIGLDIASPPNTGWQGCRSNKGVKTPGEYFYEAHVLEDGLARIGWSTNNASLHLGTDDHGYGFGADESGAGWGDQGKGRALNNNISKEYGRSVNVDDFIGCRINLNNGELAWYLNGRPMNVAFKIPEQMRAEPFFPALSLKDGRVEFNFGDSAFVYPPSDSEQWIPACQARDINQVPNKYIGWRLNAYDSTNGMDVSGDGLMAQSQSNQGWQGTKCNKGVKGRGKYYFEATSLENGGLARVGWATDVGSLDLGTDNAGFGYGADMDGYGLTRNQGKKMFKNDIENYGKAIKKGDTIGCLLNLNEGKMQWALNGEIYGVAYDIPLELRNGPSAFFPTVSLKNNTIDMNFGEKMFKFYPGSEWNPLTYTPDEFMKESRKRGPERKVRGLSYLNPDYDEDSDEREMAEESDNDNRLQSHGTSSSEPTEFNKYDAAPVVSKTGSRTVTNGEVTEVATNEPCVETETYYDELGNLVKRTITKTKRITKTTKTMSELVTERSENDVATVRTDRINRKVSRGGHDDSDDSALRRAILSVTCLDNDTAVLDDYVGSLEFVSNKNPQKVVESEI